MKHNQNEDFDNSDIMKAFYKANNLKKASTKIVNNHYFVLPFPYGEGATLFIVRDGVVGNFMRLAFYARKRFTHWNLKSSNTDIIELNMVGLQEYNAPITILPVYNDSGLQDQRVVDAVGLGGYAHTLAEANRVLNSNDIEHDPVNEHMWIKYSRTLVDSLNIKRSLNPEDGLKYPIVLDCE